MPQRIVLAFLLGITLAASPCAAAAKSPAATTGLKEAPAAPTEEFVGPLPGWLNAKTGFGAVGDGKADDTAALQKALNALPISGKSKPDDPHVLYLPAGTYRITDTLRLEERSEVALLGEDPANTKVLYDGAAGGQMLYVEGVSRTRFGRITWDGQGKASAGVAHQWNPELRRGQPGTYNSHTDEVFVDVARGIIGGAIAAVVRDGEVKWYNHGMDAETVVTRCKFVRNSEAGLSIESFNALDWWVWDSEFVDCNVGATNCTPGAYGGGHCHLYRCLFRGSKVADIRTGHASYFGIRLNTSIGSRRFLETFRPTGYKGFGRWSDSDTYGSVTSLQGNTVYQTTDPTPVWINQHGPLILLDNIFVARAPSNEPVIKVSPPTDGASAIAIGNRFQGGNKIEVRGSLFERDDKIVSGQPEPRPQLPPTAPNLKRRIIALTPAATTAEVQAAIDQATALRGQQAVVYLSSGRYNIDRTLVIPAQTDLQLMGDGNGTLLTWDGEPGGTLMQVNGPSRATLRDFAIVGIWSKRSVSLGRGLVANNIDDAGGQILLDQLNTGSTYKGGAAFLGLRRTRVEAVGLQCGSNTDGPALVVDGGGDANSPTVGLFGSAGSNSKTTHLVRGGGNLLVWDTWYETAVSKADSEPRYIQLKDSGSLTFFNGHIATLPGKEARHDLPAIDLDGFQGRFTMIGTVFHAFNPQVRLAGNGNQLRYLALANHFAAEQPALQNESAAAQFAVVACRQNGQVVPDSGHKEESFLLDMLKQARTTLPTYWQPAPVGATDLRIHRVVIQYKVGEGVIFTAGKPLPPAN